MIQVVALSDIGYLMSGFILGFIVGGMTVGVNVYFRIDRMIERKN